jgi:hypothetical protein
MRQQAIIVNNNDDESLLKLNNFLDLGWQVA